MEEPDPTVLFTGSDTFIDWLHDTLTKTIFTVERTEDGVSVSGPDKELNGLIELMKGYGVVPILPSSAEES